MPIRLVQILAMLCCMSFAILIKWVWPYDASLIGQPIPTMSTAVPVSEDVNAEAAIETADSDDALMAALSFQPDLYVNPIGGDDSSGDGSVARPWHTIQQALQAALPGATVHLADGIYAQDVRSVRTGTQAQPIRLVGGSKAIISGNGAVYVVDIRHDYIELEGFTIDGLWLPDAPNRPDAYRRKLVYAHTNRPNEGITGLRVLSMTLQNAGDECLRLKYFATLNEVAFSNFKNCGQLDFRFGGAGKNGENIYIGTAPNQLDRNPTLDLDQSNDNWIHHNVFVSNGNECVDIKEGSSRNVIEYNDCASQQDSASGGFNVRGNDNVFRFNRIFGNRGAGIRLGGTTANDGVGNHVYYNEIVNNAAGGVKFQRQTEGVVCGNRASVKPAVGEFATYFAPAAPCPSGVPRPIGLLGRHGGVAIAETLVRSDVAIAQPFPGISAYFPSWHK